MKRITYAPDGFQAYGEKEIEAVKKCLEDGFLAGFGPKTIEFEKQIAAKFGKKYGVFVNSGSSANLLALACLGLPKGTKVLTVACTFATTLSPIVQLGLQPIFIDVERTTYVAFLPQIMSKIDEDEKREIKVIMLPNLIGNKPSWKYIKEFLIKKGRPDIILIEDSCDTITETLESDISTTSFYASHMITSGGSGGMLMFNNEKLKNIALQYRDWGRMGDNSEIMSDRFNHVVDGIPYDHKFLYSVLGYNFKSSEMNAAFGLVQLEKLEVNKAIRRANTECYLEQLKDVKEILLPSDKSRTNWLAMPLQINEKYTKKTRLELLTFLEENNIQTRVTFSGNITRHPAYRGYYEEFPISDKIMEYAFLLGLHQGLNLEDIDYTCNKIKEFFQ